jgi:hypothetical protein
MKRISLLILSFAFAQELQFLWAESLGDNTSTTYDRCRSIEYDTERNVYSAGYFSGTVYFEWISLSKFALLLPFLLKFLGPLGKDTLPQKHEWLVIKID